MDTKALRQKILDLAIRGKLVPQDPNDEPASVLLERIREQKKQMVKEGKLKAKDIKGDSVIFVGEDSLHYEKFADGSVKCIENEILFEIPEGWNWTRLQSITSILTDGTHKTPQYSDDGYIFLSSRNVTSGKIDWDNIMYIPETLHQELYTRLAPKVGDILLAKNGTTGVVAIVDREEVFDIYVSLALIRIVDNIVNPLYVLRAIESSYIQGYFNSSLKGIGVPNLHLEHIRKALIPIPPCVEQDRIISQADMLLPLVEQIATDEMELHHLVSKAKAKIIDLAIRGQLVPQNPNDEPASVLLERIRVEKEELIKQGKIKRDKKESVILKGEDNSYYEKIGNKSENINDNIPFEIPDTWNWCRGYTCFSGMESKKPTGDFFDYIDIDSIDNHNHKIKEPKHLLVSDAPSRASRAVQIGSVLFSFVRPYLENIALIEEKYANSIASTGFYVCNSGGALYPEYMFLLMISGYVVSGLNQFMKGDNSPSISKDNIENWLYPIPPFEEQKVICNKIKSLFSKIEAIEKSLS